MFRLLSRDFLLKILATSMQDPELLPEEDPEDDGVEELDGLEGCSTGEDDGPEEAATAGLIGFTANLLFVTGAPAAGALFGSQFPLAQILSQSRFSNTLSGIPSLPLSSRLCLCWCRWAG